MLAFGVFSGLNISQMIISESFKDVDTIVFEIQYIDVFDQGQKLSKSNSHVATLDCGHQTL